MASIKDIAKICGVSVATVSKALNDKKDVGEETKQRIKEVARQQGYFPQYYARAIRMNKSYNIGVLFVDESMSGLTHDYFSDILNSFKVTAEGEGYDITFINSNKKHKKSKTYLEHCRYRGLDGVVIACIDFCNPEVKELVESDIPVIMIDYEMKNRRSVISNNAKGMRQLVEYIIAQGHRKIAYIAGDSTSVVTDIREESLRAVLRENHIELPEEYLLSSEYRNLQKAAEFTRKLLQLPEPPTCIIYSDDYSAVGGIGEIKRMGLEIPKDISVAGYDDIFIAGKLQPRLTTVRQNTEKIGSIAAEQLIRLMEGRPSENIAPIIVDTELIPGASVKKIV
jgi:LacI family transcriptional regulator/LacI family purine nucleotide synthesis repressor